MINCTLNIAAHIDMIVLKLIIISLQRICRHCIGKIILKLIEDQVLDQDQDQDHK